MVIRLRFFSTTEEPDSDEVMPPPNIDDKPPPLPLCNRISTISSRLVAMARMDSAVVMGAQDAFLATDGYRVTRTPASNDRRTFRVYPFGRSLMPAVSRTTISAIRTARCSGRRLVASIQRRYAVR